MSVMKAHSRRRPAAAVGVFLAAVSLVVGPSRARADAPAGGEDPMAVQMRLIAAADRIAPSVAGTTGFAGITIEAPAGQLRIYWKGDLPPAVRDAVELERANTDIEVLRAPYSRQELEAAGPEILAADGVTGVAAQPDGSALLVMYEGDERSARSLPAIASTPVPVLISAHEHPVLAAGRQADISPYSGGSMYHFPVGNAVGYCTTGFAIRVGSVNKILSAGHCRDDGDRVYEGSGTSTTLMGTVSGTSKEYDTLLIDADSAGKVFYGAHTSLLTKGVHEVVTNYPKTMICTSGAMTGQNCGARITHTNLTIKVEVEGGGWYPIAGMVRAERQPKDVAAALGDSGGPVVAMDSTVEGFTLVYPLGTVTAIDREAKVQCGAVQFAWTICSARVYYADINLALVRYSATMVT